MKPQQMDKQAPPPQGVNYADMAIAFIALVPELLLHDPRTFGVRSVAPRGGGAVVATYVFALFYTYDDKTPLIALSLVTAILAICAYISAKLHESRGQYCHSRYNGRPWLVRIFPISEARAKRAEPLLIVMAGWALHHWNCPLGSFVITAGFCYGFRVVLEYLGTRTRVLDFNDALAEQSVAMQAMKRVRRR